jgi:hypothetical protein
MDQNSQQARRRTAFVLLFYVALTVVLAWPLVSHISGRLAGYSSDVYLNQWVDWWTKKALLEGLDLYHTNYIFYPAGTSLVFHSFSYVNSAISLGLEPVIGQVPAYNVMILLAYPLSAFAMYLLVHELTGGWQGALLAGIVYAFQPYHIFESAHPIIVSTQWMPLFVLSLSRMLHATGRRRLGQMLLAALWFVLTALSSWHLMVMLAGLGILYLGYQRFVAKSSWGPGVLLWLVLLAAVLAAVLTPLLYPMLEEQLADEAACMAVDPEDGVANDLMSLFIPNRRHPLGSLVAAFHERIGFSTRRPGYLGYVALALALVGLVRSARDTKFWLMLFALSVVASLGLKLEWGGVPLHGFELPWARPIIALLRNPFRLNVLVFYSLAVLCGFGVQRIWTLAYHRHHVVAGILLAAILLLVIGEYLVVPFPTTEPQYSPFIQYLAQQEDKGLAVADFPMGRQPAKYYMYLQTFYGAPMLDGHVSRTPDNAYDFVLSNPLLSALYADAGPGLGIDIAGELSALSAQGINFVILHKKLPNADGMSSWPSWMDAFPTPFYADEWLVAYHLTGSEIGEGDAEKPAHVVDVSLGEDVSLVGYTLRSASVHAGEPILLTLYWVSDGPLSSDYHVFVHLLSATGQLVAQHDGIPAYSTRPVSTWQVGEIVHDDHMLFPSSDLAPGGYAISTGMYDGLTVQRLPAVTPDGTRLADDRITLQEVQVVPE